MESVLGTGVFNSDGTLVSLSHSYSFLIEKLFSGEMWKYVADHSPFTDDLFIVFKDSTAPSRGQCLRERELATSNYSTAELLKSSINSASVCGKVTLSISRCAS